MHELVPSEARHIYLYPFYLYQFIDTCIHIYTRERSERVYVSINRWIGVKYPITLNMRGFCAWIGVIVNNMRRRRMYWAVHRHDLQFIEWSGIGFLLLGYRDIPRERTNIAGGY